MARRNRNDTANATKRHWNDEPFKREEFNELVRWMWTEGYRAYLDHYNGTAGIATIYHHVQNHQDHAKSPWKLFFDLRLLDSYLRLGRLWGDVESHTPCLVLPPMLRFGIVPILALQFRFRSAQGTGSDPMARVRDCYPEVRLRVVLFWQSKENPHPIKCVGYRIEVPEGPGASSVTHSGASDSGADADEEEPGSHDFVHIQHITAFRKGAPPLPDVVELPATAPAWPMWGWDPTSMLVSLIVGVYGLNYAAAEISGIAGDIVRDRLATLIGTPAPKHYHVGHVNRALHNNLDSYILTWPQQKDVIATAIRETANVGGDTDVIKEVQSQHEAEMRAKVKSGEAKLHVNYWESETPRWRR